MKGVHPYPKTSRDNGGGGEVPEMQTAVVV